MRKLGVFVFAVSLSILFSSPALAATSAYDQVVVTAAVPIHRTIIIDSSNHIDEIMTNSPVLVQPQVYVNFVSAPNLRPLSPAIYVNYLLLLKNINPDKIGVIYSYVPPASKPVVAFAHTHHRHHPAGLNFINARGSSSFSIKGFYS